MRSKALGLLPVAAFFIYSCEKELSRTNNSSQTENNLLFKITQYTDDYTYIDSFLYDSQNRCRRLYKIGIDSFTGPTLNVGTSYYDFYYNGTETLPYKITGDDAGTGINWWILYDAQQRKILDSQIYVRPTGKRIVKYSYSNNRIIANSDIWWQNEFAIIRDTFDYDGNNCTKWRSYSKDIYGQIWYDITLTYDNYTNPLSELNIFRAVLFGVGGTLGDYKGLNRNNYTKIVYSDPYIGTPESWRTTTYQYTYDSIGRPTLSTAHSLINPSFFWTTKFEYNK